MRFALILWLTLIGPVLWAAPNTWPPVSAVEALHLAKNYPGIRAATTGLVFDSATQSDLTGARLLYFRGNALYREIYQARALQAPESEKPVEPVRASFEVSYDEATTKALATALSDLTLASELNNFYNGLEASGHDPQLAADIPRALGLALMEQALYVTQDPADFYKASAALREARTYTGYQAGAFDSGPAIPLRTSPTALAFEVIALVAQGQYAEARALSAAWSTTVDADLRSYRVTDALVSAYDLVGEYERTRAMLLGKAVRQIQEDAGKYDPARHTATRAAIRTHFNNLNFALQMKNEKTVPALRAARVAGALSLRGKLDESERNYVLGVPKLKGGNWSRFATQAGLLRAIRIQLDSADMAERQAGSTALKAALKITPDDDIARALLARAQLRLGETEVALSALNGVIERDPFLAAVIGAYTDRAAAFSKLDRATEAAKDARNHAQFENLLGKLASP